MLTYGVFCICQLSLSKFGERTLDLEVIWFKLSLISFRDVHCTSYQWELDDTTKLCTVKGLGSIFATFAIILTVAKMKPSQSALQSIWGMSSYTFLYPQNPKEIVKYRTIKTRNLSSATLKPFTVPCLSISGDCLYDNIYNS